MRLEHKRIKIQRKAKCVLQQKRNFQIKLNLTVADFMEDLEIRCLNYEEGMGEIKIFFCLWHFNLKII